MPDQLELKSIELKGFKSVDAEGQMIELRPITVMLGANGAGKSNLVSFFKMLNYMTTGGLQQYVADRDLPIPYCTSGLRPRPRCRRVCGLRAGERRKSMLLFYREMRPDGFSCRTRPSFSMRKEGLIHKYSNSGEACENPS